MRRKCPLTAFCLQRMRVRTVLGVMKGSARRIPIPPTFSELRKYEGVDGIDRIAR
jgi:hypothetical protein